MRALAASPLGFLVGLALGALGGGGSVLAIPALVYVAGQDPRAATTTSLVIVGAAALVGIADHWRAGRVRLRTGILFGTAGIGGSVAGSLLNRDIDPDLLLLLFAGLIVVAAWRMVTGCPSCTRVGEQGATAGAGAGDAGLAGDAGGEAVATRQRTRSAVAPKVVVAGTLIGFFTGLFGVGGGFVIVPALTLLLGFAMPQAIGTSLVIVAVNAAVALLARVGTGVDWAITLPFAATALAGVLAGSRVADRLPARVLLRWFAGLLVAVAAYTAADAVVGLL